MTDTDKSEESAEPVDAEFEPAPDDGPSASPEGDGETGSGASGGGVKLVLFVIAAAAIGGAAGFGLSRYLPADAAPGGELAALEDRLAAVEAREGPDLSTLTERVNRLESVVQAREGLSSRVETLAASIEQLEDSLAAGPATSGSTPDGAPVNGADGAALAELEQRVGEAFTQVQSRLEALEDEISAARSDAEAARSAAQQANTALSSLSAGAGADGAPSDSRIAALSGRLDALDEALTELGAVVRPLTDLPGRVDALADQMTQAGDAASGDAASSQAVSGLRRRLSTLSDELSALSDRVGALEAGARPNSDRSSAPSEAAAEPAGLAARALAFAALSEAASGSAPFAVELEALARVWPQAPGLEALRGVAREGAPTPDRLEDSFPAEALREATGETQTYFGFLRISRDENAGAAAAIEAALAGDDLAEAARLAGVLDEAGRSAIAHWREGLEARLAVRRALTQQSAALAAAGERE